MLERLKNLFSPDPAASATGQDEAEQARVQLAAAALLAHAARLDGHLDEIENQTLHSLFIDRFALTQTEAQDLLALAHAEEAKATDLYRWTSVINKTYNSKWVATCGLTFALLQWHNWYSARQPRLGCPHIPD